LVEEVLPGSPAAAAGVLVGDLIIEANGQPIKGPVDLAMQLFQQNVGDTITLKLKRAGDEKTVSVKVGSQNESD
jgi:S1-C subfamily serine protease